jgi:hypothetical protein
MKVTVRYEPQDDEDDELETSFSLTLPKAWLAGPTAKLKSTFVDQFNKKHGSSAMPLDKATCRLETKGGTVLNDTAIIESCIKENDELWVRRPNAKPAGEKPKPVQPAPATSAAQPAAPSATRPPGSVPCKRFGCGKWFVPGQPSAEPCHHHKKPPVFHETRKYWACCPDKVAWDWESFQAIPGCETLETHSNETDAAAKKVMGGTELRAEIQGPQQLNATAEKKLTGLDKLMQVRASLVQLGVSGDAFDGARDSIKRLHEDAEGKNVWDKVCSEMSSLLELALSRAGSE